MAEVFAEVKCLTDTYFTQVDGGGMLYRPLNYEVYDHGIFTRCQAPWGRTKLIWSVNWNEP